MKATSKLEIANAILKTFAPNTSIEKGQNGWVVSWTTHRGKKISRRWQASTKGSFYPSWYHRWPHGGTACTALAQLVFWLRDEPVLPLSTWRYWVKLKLGSQSTLDLLAQAGWPETPVCVKCGNLIPEGVSFDWFNLANTSGPGCYSQCEKPPFLN